MIRRPPRSTQSRSSAASDVYKRQDPASLSQLLAPVFDPKEWKAIPVATKGLPASPGAASGQVVFTADEAVTWTEQGKKVVLVRKETVPDDIHGMFAVSYTHLRAHETRHDLVCRLL